MNFLDKFESKFGRFAIKGLMLYIITLNFLAFLLYFMDRSGVYIGKLVLVPELVMKGEIWRLITFIFIPPTTSYVWIIFVLYFYYLIGTGLEHEWGSFKFNMYYFLGMLGTIIGSFISGYGDTGLYLNLSLFFAFAFIYPDYQILLFFIIPVKIKYLAWLNWAFFIYNFIFAPIYDKIAIAISILNFFLFFGGDIFKTIANRRKNFSRNQKFRSSVKEVSYIHKCQICGITENENPNIEFRYCNDCDGDYEYCMEHLNKHEHIKH